MLALAIRLVFSLAVVLGLLLLLAKVGGRRFRGGKDALVQVVHRQAISRGTAVSVVTVAGRVLVLGTTEQQVRLLTELDPEELAGHLPELGPDAEMITLVRSPEDSGTLVEAPPALPAGAPIRPAPTRPAGTHRAAHRSPRRPAEGALAGSVLSADTWRQAFAAATRRAS